MKKYVIYISLNNGSKFHNGFIALGGLQATINNYLFADTYTTKKACQDRLNRYIKHHKIKDNVLYRFFEISELKALQEVKTVLKHT